ncbi:hypothetical protein AB4114_11060 [Paenibacillus sp. 2RAB27]|uniref:hypothetical protein n=1 Tax=Paenibacillus sp. 2RAB27 TaxID=3232991 RepID=UPI003F95E43F
MLDVIKSYLVSLGFNVDRASFGQATQSMNTVEQSVSKFANTSVTKFAIAGAAVTTFVTTAVFGLAKFVGELAKADLEMEKLARQMWTSKDNAMAFDSTLKAMKVSLNDLYLSPELMRNFQMLRQQAMNMRAPAEYASEMKFIRSIQLEFTRLRLEAKYAMQWVGYYLVQYMAGPLTKIKAGLMNINDAIVKYMPVWTKEVARVLSWFIRAGETLVHFGRDVGGLFDKLAEKIPANLRIIGAAIVALGLLIKTGPIGILIFALTGLILLLDDFYTYMQGGESALGPLWEKLPEFMDKISLGATKAITEIGNLWDKLKDSKAADEIKKSFENVTGIFKSIAGGIKYQFKDIYEELQKRGEFQELKTNLAGLATAVAELGAAWSGMIDETLELEWVQTALKGVAKIITTVVVQAVDTLNKSLAFTRDLIGAIAAIINKDLPALAKIGNRSKESIQDNITPSQKEALGGTSDTIVNAMKNFNRFFGKMFGGGGESSNYMYPQASSNTNNNNNKVTVNQTNNIYGSDPQANADSVSDSMRTLTRNMRGAQGW